MQLVVNVTQNWGIGMQNQLLVTISADLKRFRRLTTGKTVILGHSTLATFPGGKPLKNRRNLVLSRNPDLVIEGAEVYPDIPSLLTAVKALDKDSVSVIGGASIYEALLEYCDTAFVTKTYVEPEADRFFPNLDQLPNWQIAEQSEIFEENGVTYQYIDYINTAPKALP